MILKYLQVTDTETEHHSEWVYLDGVIRAISRMVSKTAGKKLDTCLIEVEFQSREREIVFAYHSAFLMSSETGTTLERLL